MSDHPLAAETSECNYLHDTVLLFIESKLAKMKAGTGAKSAASMINTLKMAREDSARILISQSVPSTTEQCEEPYSFLDKLYSTNAVYRHMFPATQALGTDEKELLLRNDELSKALDEENVSFETVDGNAV